MRKWMPILLLFLGASLLVNILALSRLLRDPNQHRGGRNESARPGAEGSARELQSLKDQLSAERRSTEELRRRILELERAGALVQPSSFVGGPANPTASKPTVPLRDKLRKFIRMILSQRGEEGQQTMDPEIAREIMDAVSEYYPALFGPAKDPGRYATFMEAVWDVTMEELGAPLSEDQKQKLGEMMARLKVSLGEVGDLPAGEQMMGELRAKKDLYQGLIGVLTPEQARKLFENPGMTFDTMENVRWLSRDQTIRRVSADWAQTFKLTEAQRPAAEAAARSFAEALNRLDDEYKAKFGKAPLALGSGQLTSASDAGHFFDYRMSALRAQIDALKMIEGALTPEQRQNLTAKRPWEYRLQEGAQLAPPVAEKQ